MPIAARIARGPSGRLPPRQPRAAVLAHQRVLLDRRGLGQAIQGVEFEVVVADVAGGRYRRGDSRPVDMTRTYQDVPAGMRRKTRGISKLTENVGHHW
jgi:hypothetical protein